MKQIRVLTLTVLLTLVSAGLTTAQPPEGWTPGPESPVVPLDQLYRMLAEQARFEAECGELMPVLVLEPDGGEHLECREPAADWWPGQP